MPVSVGLRRAAFFKLNRPFIHPKLVSSVYMYILLLILGVNWRVWVFNTSSFVMDNWLWLLWYWCEEIMNTGLHAWLTVLATDGAGCLQSYFICVCISFSVSVWFCQWNRWALVCCWSRSYLLSEIFCYFVKCCQDMQIWYTLGFISITCAWLFGCFHNILSI